MYFDVIVYLPQFDNWETFHRRPVLTEFARQLPGEGKILGVLRPFCLLTTPFLHPAQVKEIICCNRLSCVEDRLFLYRPVTPLHDRVLPYIPGGKLINTILLTRQLSTVLHQSGFRSSYRLVWVYSPLQIDYLELVAADLKVYECYDEYALAPGLTPKARKLLRENEVSILSRVNLVFVNSQPLLAKSKFNRNVYPLYAGVEFDHFLQSSDPRTVLPPEILRINLPIIGYIGVINKKMDFNLIYDIAKNHPDWSFLFIGRIDDRGLSKDWAYLQAKHLQNVYYLGEKPYAQLPAYLRSFDVCLMPFVIDEFSKYVHHNKLYQYLASGKPIVSTPVEEVGAFREVLYVSDGDVSSFCRCIEHALAEKWSESLFRERIRIAKENSWKQRITDVINVINSHLQKISP